MLTSSLYQEEGSKIQGTDTSHRSRRPNPGCYPLPLPQHFKQTIRTNILPRRNWLCLQTTLSLGHRAATRNFPDKSMWLLLHKYRGQMASTGHDGHGGRCEAPALPAATFSSFGGMEDRSPLESASSLSSFPADRDAVFQLLLQPDQSPGCFAEKGNRSHTKQAEGD